MQSKQNTILSSPVLGTWFVRLIWWSKFAENRSKNILVCVNAVAWATRSWLLLFGGLPMQGRVHGAISFFLCCCGYSIVLATMCLTKKIQLFSVMCISESFLWHKTFTLTSLNIFAWKHINLLLREKLYSSKRDLRMRSELLYNFSWGTQFRNLKVPIQKLWLLFIMVRLGV